MNKTITDLAKLTKLFIEEIEKVGDAESAKETKLNMLREYAAQARKLVYQQPNEPMTVVMLDEVKELAYAPVCTLTLPNTNGSTISARCYITTGRALVDIRSAVPVGTAIDAGRDNRYIVISTDMIQDPKGEKYSLCAVEER